VTARVKSTGTCSWWMNLSLTSTLQLINMVPKWSSTAPSGTVRV